MFTKEMKDFAERKRLIVLESELHRGVIGLECAALSARMVSARAEVRTGSRWLLAASAVTGFLAARRGKGLAGLIPGAFAAWRWFRRRPLDRE